MSSRKDQLIIIQYLRAIAALMVVLHHAKNPTAWLFDPLAGYPAFAWGVDIFFVISGFIMYVAARGENHLDFLGRRIIRVAPLYWAVTFVLLAINTKFHVWRIDADSAIHILKSVFFIPHHSPDYPDEIWPYLIPGWTLNYEMLFYIIFFFGLTQKRILPIVSTTILGFCVLGFFVEPDNAVIKTYTDPIILEFLSGVWIAHLYVSDLFGKHLAVLLPVGFLGLLLLPITHEHDVIVIGKIVFSSAIIVGAASTKSAMRSNFLRLLGDASYSIYLTHHFISLRLSSLVWKQVPIDGWLQFAGYIVLALSVSSIVGIVVHLYLEKPMLKWLQAKWRVVMIRKSSLQQAA